MRNEKTLPRLLLISAIAAMLLMALMFDFIVMTMQVSNSQGAGLEPVLVILFSVFQLLLTLGAMGILWYLFSSGERSRLTTWAFLLVGLLVLFATPLLFFLPVPVAMLMLVEFVQPGTFAFQVGAMLAAIGILSLFVRPQAAAAPVEPVEAPAALAEIEE